MLIGTLHQRGDMERVSADQELAGLAEERLNCLGGRGAHALPITCDALVRVDADEDDLGGLDHPLRPMERLPVGDPQRPGLDGGDFHGSASIQVFFEPTHEPCGVVQAGR